MEEEKENVVKPEETPVVLQEKPKKKKKKIGVVVLLVLILLGIAGYISYEKFFKDKKENKENETEIKLKEIKSAYRLSGNSLEDFDLYFLQLENENQNKIYSPLSIKYALGMLSEGSRGESKNQIDSIIGDYAGKKYINSKNMSFANGLFIRDSFASNINDEYISNLKTKFNAEVINDSFDNANNINFWVKNKTFSLIDKMIDEVDNKDFVLINALAIDMEWENKIQSEVYAGSFDVQYSHEKAGLIILPLDLQDYYSLNFNNNISAKSVEIGAIANRYDIVNELGEENIRKTVGKAYEEWLAKGEGRCSDKEEPDVNTYLDQYIKDINSNYEQIDSSTDFYFYNDKNIKVFAKDLKEYDGTTLQYVGIMPKEDTLDNYIKETKASKISSFIDNLKPIEISSFSDKKITQITGYIPMFKFDYELSLMNDLKQLGITNVFDPNKADISGITSVKSSHINSALHQANIEFSNEGIKAAAVTVVTGSGDTHCGFEYDYEVPIERIDLTFDKPYMYLIRDKESGEIWFVGTVYEPIEFEAFTYSEDY